MHINKEKRDIRIVFLVFAVLLGLLARKLHPSVWATLVIALDAVLVFFVLFLPLKLRPLFAAWMKVAHLLGRINTQILLFVFFILIFVPAGLLMRLFRADPLNRKRTDAPSYWEPYETAGLKDRSRYERQF